VRSSGVVFVGDGALVYECTSACELPGASVRSWHDYVMLVREHNNLMIDRIACIMD
jgi:hypothetical protein